MRNTTALLAVTAAALLALTSCSSNDDAKPSTAPKTAEEPTTTPTNTPAPADTAGLERVAATYTDLYFGGSGKAAYAFLSKRCQGKADPAVYEATVKQAAEDYGSDHPATDVHATVSGDLGRVSYKVKGLPKFDQEQQPWAREGGTWKYDAC
ncbi:MULTISPECIES: hypothetical protein [unclassified Streptomyces]|uniref:hypothetical protein n=1 Tax=unclassified Streptomyces TaxID=2593676 RepID=UPI002E294697|nr:hypothetical protein [Streptomyces sp. NBC_00228]